MKRCQRCGEEKPLNEFNKRSNSRDGLQKHCRACASSYYQGNVVRHKENCADRARRVRLENAQRVWDYLLHHPCVDCGEADPVVLDFDHVRGRKTNSVSSLVRRVSASWATIQAEIAKCDIRCANCHRRRTAVQLGWYADIVR
jgi:hypothetical protein